MTIQPRGKRIRSGRRWLQCFAVASVLAGAGANPPPIPPKSPAPAVSDYDKQVVAYVYGTMPIHRRELGEYLIDRGGMDSIEIVINKRILMEEAMRRNVSVTPTEIDAGLYDDLRRIGMGPTEFEAQVLIPRYGKTMFEWAEDIVYPRLLIGKMCHDRTRVTEAEIQQAFNVRYGEQREARVIVYPYSYKDKTPSKRILDDARTNPDAFDKLAAEQPDSKLAAVGGRIMPMRRNPDSPDKLAETTLFSLKVGETSEWVVTTKQDAVMCVKCTGIIPPNPKITLDKKVHEEIEKDLFEKKLNVETPKMLDELRKGANPHLTQHVPPRAESATPRTNVEDRQVLAVIYGNVPVTRQDLGEFLIVRKGGERLELLVNKRIIEIEANKRGIVLTPQELKAGLAQELSTYKDGLGITEEDFIKAILPSKGKTFFEWTEDVTRPRLILSKMCRDRVKVTEEDLQKAFENQYGEKRQAKLIIWPKDQPRVALKQWDEARSGNEAFDSLARRQPDANLAANCGLVTPIGRHGDAENSIVEKTLFSLRVGEISQILETPAGFMCVKCWAIIPPAAGATLAAVRANLEKEIFEKKMAREIPNYFNELKKQANPNQLLKGPPSRREYAEGAKQFAEGAKQIANTLPSLPADVEKK